MNGHEYLKRQLAKRGMTFEALDNGILSCADPGLMQRLADGIDAVGVDALLHNWLARLPHPFTAADRATIRYDVAVLAGGVPADQVLDRPVQGRVLFEEIIRENVDLGRPDHVQLIFDRRVTRRTPSRYRTRVTTEASRPRCTSTTSTPTSSSTETVVNDVPSEGRASTFGVNRKLINLDDLKQVGFAANRRLLGVQRISHDPPLGQDTFDGLHRPAVVDDRRASALRFGDPRVQALLATLLAFRLLPEGFANREFREHVGPLLADGGYGSNRATSTWAGCAGAG